MPVPPHMEERARIARAKLVAMLERLILEDIAADYRNERDPSENLKSLLKLLEQKKQFRAEYKI